MDPYTGPHGGTPQAVLYTLGPSYLLSIYMLATGAASRGNDVDFYHTGLGNGRYS